MIFFTITRGLGGGILEWFWKGGKQVEAASIETLIEYPNGLMPLRYKLGIGATGQTIDSLTEHPETVLVCEKDEMGTNMRRLDETSLKNWLKNYSLGELWRKGEIGGNRW